MLLRQLAIYMKSNPDRLPLQIALDRENGEDAHMQAASPVIENQAEIAEGQGMAAHQIVPAARSGFTHFLDGTQIARRIGFYDYTVPVIYGFIGAVIRQRNGDRRMSTYAKESSENLYFSFPHLDPKLLQTAGISARNATEKPTGDGHLIDVHPLRLLEIAREEISNDRAELEKHLADKWVVSSSINDWLFWDGSITGSADVTRHGRVVGVIKSHQTQYFGAAEQKIILSLRVGERSSIFKPCGKYWNPVYSWYLRLRPNDGRDLYFGLIRVEMPASEETLEQADVISGWLMAERAPLALPDGRWDRMIYPIRDCEQYLRSISPSRVMIEAALAGCER